MVEEGLAILFFLKLITGEGDEKENCALLPYCRRLVELLRRLRSFETETLAVSALWRYMKNSNLI